MQQQAFFFEVYRSGLRAAADMMKTSLESAERMQNQQLEGIRSAMEETVRSTRQLSEVSNLGDLMAVQTRFAGVQVERTIDFWTRAWRSAGETQAALIGQAQNQIGQMGERVREGYAMGARSADDAARFAGSQAANIGSGQERKERKSA
jgi:phasin family protein